MRSWICTRCYTAVAVEKAESCPACGSPDIVPVDSPRGKQLVAAPNAPGAAPPDVAPETVVAVRRAAARGQTICPSCYAVGHPRKTGPSSIAQLFLVAMIPVAYVGCRALVGPFSSAPWIAAAVTVLMIVIYSVQPTRLLCASCGNAGVIPVESARGQELLAGRRP